MVGASNVTLSAGASCRTGKRRANNEDNFFLDGFFKPLDKADVPIACSARSEGGGVYAVCDGMGGQAHGERAAWMSAYGLSLFRDALLEGKEPLEALVERCISSINLSIVGQCRKHHCQMGSTLALAVLSGSSYHIFNLGDSRIYLYAENSLTQLSKDHTETQSLVDMGIVLSGRDPSAKDGALVQYLGIPAEEMILKPHSATGTLHQGERLLLCSDGLTDMLSDDKIVFLLSQSGTPEELALRLTHAAEKAGGKDNVTALVISIIQ